MKRHLPPWAVRIGDRLDDVDFLKSFHKWATIFWMTGGLALSIMWMSWLPWVVFMSLYANFVGHWSAWQATRAEQQQQSEEQKAA